MALPTLLDIAKLNGVDSVVGLLDEVARPHPELMRGYARTIKGQSYKTLVRTALALTTGSFRDANAGTLPLKNTHENRRVETFILNPRFEVDKAVADQAEDGPEAYIALEQGGILEGELQALCTQFYYGNVSGNGGNVKGFPGLIDSVDSSMVVDATGSTASTGSSVWAVRFGPRDVGWVWGENGKLEMSDPRIESITDPADSTKRFDGYVSSMLAYPGLQSLSKYSVGRIKKLTEDSGKGLTDTLIASLLSKFPTGWKPDVLFMTRRSQYQLRASRTATNPTGAPAPIPDEAFGIPIETTEAILNTESLSL